VPTSQKPSHQRVRLAIVSTHPIQYYAPVFRALARSAVVSLRVFFTWSQTAVGSVFDPGFGTNIAWDVPLLDGYEHQFVPNVAKRPGSDHFYGIRNPQLIRSIRAWDADAVLIYGWSLYSHLHALLHFSGRIPVLFRGDSTLLNPRNALRAAARRVFLRWVYSHVDCAIAVGKNNRDYYAWSGVPPERIAFAPHSVDTHRFADPGGEHSQRAQRWRTQLGIPADAVAVVFAAKFQPLKEPLLLLEAFNALQGRGHLIFVGAGELDGVLRERARGLANVHFLPFQNQRDMPVVYRLGEIYILPSNSETWGLAMNEAMASGRPVIASSRVGGARDLIQPSATGWIFESGDLSDLHRVLQTAVAMGAGALQQMGERARSMIAAWSPEACARAIEDVVTRSNIGRQWSDA